MMREFAMVHKRTGDKCKIEYFIVIVTRLLFDRIEMNEKYN